MLTTSVHLAPKANSEPPALSPRVVRAAHEFEAQMMNELMAPLTTRESLTGDSADEDTGSSGALGAFATESLGQALSLHGGLGIATRILDNLSHSGKPARCGPSPEPFMPSARLK